MKQLMLLLVLIIFHMEQNLTQKVQNLRCLIWLGGDLNPNETLSHSNGKFVFDHGPNQMPTSCGQNEPH